MNRAPARRSSVSPLVVFLSLVGCVCVAAAGALAFASVDVSDLVRNTLERSHGTVSAETMHWLRATNPIRLLAIAGAALIVAAIFARLFLPRVNKALARLRNWPTGSTHWTWFLAVLIGLLLIARFHSTPGSGYFRYDDFELLAFADQKKSWTDLWTLHGDHALPLTRLLAAGGLRFFGTDPVPYNLFALVSMGGVLFSACGVLTALGASRIAQILFLTLVVYWSPWAELMTGYYILSTYLLIAWFSLGAFQAHLAWCNTRNPAALAIFLLCLLLAPLLDISGAYVLAAGGVFIALGLMHEDFALSIRTRLTAHRAPLLVLGTAGAISTGWLVYVYTLLHPGTFLGMAADQGRSFARTAWDFLYAFDAGLLLTFFVPFVYARLPVSLLLLLGFASAAAWVWLMTSAARLAGPARRWTLLALLSVTAGICLMIVLGRPPEDTWRVRWAAKHIGPAYIWLSLLLALSWDSLWRKTRARGRFAELTAIALCLFGASQTAFGLLGMAVDFPPFGYDAEIRDARRRSSAVNDLRTHVASKLLNDAGAALTAPTLDGANIAKIHPSLFSYNLSHYAPFFGRAAPRLDLVRNDAMQSWHSAAVRTVPVLRDAVSPEFIKRLETDASLRRYYFAQILLHAKSPSKIIRPASGSPRSIESDGRTELLVHEGAWDPETAARLHLRITREGPPAPVRVAVVFYADAVGADWKGTVDLTPSANGSLVIDLRQACAFSLSRRVSGLRLVFFEAGIYQVHLAEIVP